MEIGVAVRTLVKEVRNQLCQSLRMQYLLYLIRQQRKLLVFRGHLLKSEHMHGKTFRP